MASLKVMPLCVLKKTIAYCEDRVSIAGFLVEM